MSAVALEDGIGRLLALRDATAEAAPGPGRDAGARYRRLFDELREHVFIYTVVRDGAGQVIDWVLADANRRGAPPPRRAARARRREARHGACSARRRWRSTSPPRAR